MTLAEFEAEGATPPDGLFGPGLALWWDRRGDWSRAHAIVADDDSPEAAWVHAYLHRKEGDLCNARYWYRRAGRSEPGGDLASEAAGIARALLGP